MNFQKYPKLGTLVVTLIAFFLSGSKVSDQIKGYEDHESGLKLSHLIVEVNGDLEIVETSKVLSIVAGDKIKILEAKLLDSSVDPTLVNFVGFANPKSNRGEDRGIEIDTLSKLKKKWAIDDEKRVYAVIATSEKTIHGAVYIKILPPKLWYVDALINGQVRVLREEEPLVVKLSDKVKINKINTNVKDKSKIKYQIVETNNEDMLNKHLRPAKSYEIQFLLGKTIFAKIPMLVEEL